MVWFLLFAVYFYVATEKKEETAIRELSEQERLQIMSSEEFQKFFDRTSRILERALTEEVILNFS